MMNQVMKIERWNRILSILGKLDFLTTSQIATLFDLKEQNTRRILREMKDEKLILNRREHELVWYLSIKGINHIGLDKQVKYVKNNIYHYIIRNQVYVHYRPLKWNTEKQIENVKPDAIMEVNNTIYFVEIDRTQTMKTNRDKIQKYKQLKIKPFPTIIYITLSEYRQKEIRNLLENMKSEVLLYNDLK